VCGLAVSRIDAGSAAAHATAALDWSLDESWELVSWPEAAATLGPELRNGDNAKRTFEAMMTMKKIDIALSRQRGEANVNTPTRSLKILDHALFGTNPASLAAQWKLGGLAEK